MTISTKMGIWAALVGLGAQGVVVGQQLAAPRASSSHRLSVELHLKPLCTSRIIEAREGLWTPGYPGPCADTLVASFSVHSGGSTSGDPLNTVGILSLRFRIAQIVEDAGGKVAFEVMRRNELALLTGVPRVVLDTTIGTSASASIERHNLIVDPWAQHPAISQFFGDRHWMPVEVCAELLVLGQAEGPGTKSPNDQEVLVASDSACLRMEPGPE